MGDYCECKKDGRETCTDNVRRRERENGKTEEEKKETTKINSTKLVAVLFARQTRW
jgi:hypothetical protein